jgi:hypothetical protein
MQTKIAPQRKSIPENDDDRFQRNRMLSLILNLARKIQGRDSQHSSLPRRFDKNGGGTTSPRLSDVVTNVPYFLELDIARHRMIR